MKAGLRLRDLIPPLLHAVAVDHPEDEAAFDDFAAGIIRQLGLLAASVLLAAILAWWPLDRWLLPGADDLLAFTRMRTHAGGAVLLSLGVLTFTPPRTRGFAALAVALYALVLFTFTEALGTTGGDPGGADPLTWLADVWIGVVPLAVLPLRTPHRVAAVLTVTGAMVAGFFVAHPSNLQLPGAGAQVSFATFAALFTLAAGEGSYRLTRRAFFERRALDRARGALEDLTRTLSDQVADRTRALQQLTQHLDEAQEAERRRLAHDLHDDLGQQLTAMRYALVRLGGRLAHDDATSGMVQDLEALLDGTTRATRGVVTRLRPRILDDLGLVPALEWFCEDLADRTQVACAFEADEPEGLSPAAQLALFRVAQEATTNALRHGAPGSLAVRLRVEGGLVRLTVRDDGRGFTPGTQVAGFGLLGLTERLRALGGVLEVQSHPGEGTELTASLPWKEPT